MDSDTPIEDALLGFAEYTKSHLPAFLEEINESKADGIELVDFVEYTPGWKTVFGKSRYPVMLFAPEAIGLEPSANRAEQIEFPVVVFQGVKHTDPNTLMKMQLRYADAFRAMIAANRTLDGLVEFTETEIIDPAFSQEGLGVTQIRVILTIEIVT